MNRIPSLATLAGFMLAASVAVAQGTGGVGAGGAAPGAAPGAAAGGGAAAPGPAQPGAYNDQNTPGWSTMSAEQRSAHAQRMQSFRTYNECRTYMESMRARSGAKAGGPPTARSDADPCRHLPRG